MAFSYQTLADYALKNNPLDYFIKGKAAGYEFQNADQTYQLNQQLMQAREAEMAQSQLMNPLLLEQQRSNIAATDAGAAATRGGETRAQGMYQGELDYQTARNRMTNSQGDLFNFQLEHQQNLAPYEIGAAKQQNALRSQQQTLNSQTISDNSLMLNEKKRLMDQARRDEESIYIADTMKQYDAMSKDNPASAQSFVQQKIGEYEQTFGKKFDGATFNPSIAKANAVMADQRAKNIQQVPGMVGLAYNSRTGEYTADAKTMQQAIALKNKSDGVFKGKDLMDVNDKVTSLVKPHQDIITATEDLRALRKNNNSAAQLAAIFKYMKALDPASVVREGEQTMLRQTGGAYDGFVGYLQNKMGEGSLTPDVFNDIVSASESLANQASTAAEQQVNSYLDVLSDNIPASNYRKLQNRVPKLSNTQPAAPAAQAQTMVAPQAQPAQAAVPTAHNPTTGEVLYLRDGQWSRE